jgi:UDP-N-acetylmuramoylalanine--D-glutamate ligase
VFDRVGEFEAALMNYLKDTRVLVLGLGASGLAMARWCARHGAQVRVWDSREQPANAAALAEQVPQAVWVRGELTAEALAGVKLVLKSPGLSPQDERIAATLNRAVDAGVLVQGELDLFARALVDLKAERGYAPKVLAITGTNGKTTTTSMAAMLIERTGRRVAMAGNIGPTMLQTLSDALDMEPGFVSGFEAVTRSEAALEVAIGEARSAAGPHPGPLPGGEGVEQGTLADSDEHLPATGDEQLPSPSGRGTEGEGDPAPEDLADLQALDGIAAPPVDDDTAPAPLLPPPPPAAPTFEHLPDVWVLELSSFQLDDVKGFEPSAAAILNITQDHLDWHGSMTHYIAAKARVFGKHAVMVINRDDRQVEALVPAPEVVKVGKGGKGRKPVTIERSVVRFGVSAPQRPGDFGLIEEHGMAWLVRARELDETLKRSKGGKGARAADPHAEPEELLIQRLMPADALRVRGRHNACNALAALALATAIDCPLAPMLHGLREYAGEPHRVQFIVTLDGVDAYDDSKGTNVGATVAALDGLGADKAPAKLAVILGGDGKGQDFAPLAEPVRRHARAVATIGRDADAIEQALAGSGVPLQRHATLQAATRWCFEHARSGDAVLLSPACASLDMFRDYAHRAEVFVAEVRAIVADRGGVVA